MILEGTSEMQKDMRSSVSVSVSLSHRYTHTHTHMHIAPINIHIYNVYIKNKYTGTSKEYDLYKQK